MKKLAILSIVLYFSGCAIYNPFIPPNGSVIVEEGCSLPPQEPITSNAMYRSTMKPYRVKGVKYQPIVPNIGDKFRGVASWYGPNFHGRKTSNGEYYDMTSFTAAHKTLPMNTRIKVTNLDNGLSTIVRINDRGPFVNNRIIDLSQAAAQEIGMIKKGTANVELEVIDYDTSVDIYKNHTPFPQATSLIDNIKPTTKSKNNIIKPMQKAIIKTTTLDQVMDSSNYKIQLFSSSSREKANFFAKKYATMDSRYHTNIISKNLSGKKIYRVTLNGFKNENEAKAFIVNHGISNALITKD